MSASGVRKRPPGRQPDEVTGSDLAPAIDLSQQETAGNVIEMKYSSTRYPKEIATRTTSATVGSAPWGQKLDT